MKVAVLGAKWSPCAEPMDQTVVPATGLPSPSVQVKAAPPHFWTSIPRCRLYQACSAGASLALKKMPPMPVTRFIEPPRTGGDDEKCISCGLTMRLSDAGVRRSRTKLIYPNHRPPPWLTEDASPRDRSNRLLGSSSAPYSGDPPFASANLDQLPSNEQLRRQGDASSVACP